MPVELVWLEEKDQCMLKSTWLSFNFVFTPEVMTVTADMTFAAKMMATPENKKRAVKIISEVADNLDL